jgi:hypothetical protein
MYGAKQVTDGAGRRAQLAEWLASSDHPLTARVFVNRMWQFRMGEGVVKTPNDFGTLGERPTNPKLLDWMAKEFVLSAWSRKRLSREILLSQTYRRSSGRAAQGPDKDPQNLWLGRMNVRRLQTESLRDAMLASAGMLSSRMHGAPSTVNPDEVGQTIIGKATRDGNGILVAKHEEVSDAYRRSVYIQIRRSMPLGVIEPFDPAGTAPNCDRRSESTVATQSLMLMNNSSVIRICDHFANRVIRQAGDDPMAQVVQAWQFAFGVAPTESQRTQTRQWLVDQRAILAQPNPEQPTAPNAGALEPAKANEQALSLLCQALLSSNAFLYVD